MFLRSIDFSDDIGVAMRRIKKVTAVFTVSVVLAAGMAAAAPSATADSRCNTRNHTHGASWWQRTDDFLIRQYVTYGGGRVMQYTHTNSDSVRC